MKKKNRISIFLAFFSLISTDTVISEMLIGQSAKTAVAVQTALTGPHRSEANMARDRFRHPSETLAFFGLEQDMTVVEVWPGAGWYTEILAPVLKEHGRLYTAHFSSRMRGRLYQKMLSDFKQKLSSNSEVYGAVMLTALLPPDEIDILPKESADRVLTFRNVHNWMLKGEELNVFKAFYRVLKPGGILGVVEHRADPSGQHDPQARFGYVHQDYVTSVAEKAGFVLLQRSEINANPKDTKDYPKGVWTLPPRLILGDQDREKYLAIGESDRMTLIFGKPSVSDP